MGRIPQEVIDQVRIQADIVDVIQSYIPLKKMGRDFKACCPFHNEKTPSFVVNQQRQWFHCFGCGKHGNVITFVMERENVDFPNAIHILARKYHIFVPEETTYPARRTERGDGSAATGAAAQVRGNFKERLYMLHEKAQAWYARRLKESPDSPVATYLKTRELPEEIVRQFSENLGEDASGLCARLQMGIRAMLLSAHPALSSAYANDVDPQMCYAQQLFVAGRKGDVVIGLSTSGNAENIRNVFQVAGGLGIRRILFTGNRHGACERYADCVIDVPEAETYKIQELHLPVYHAVCIMLEEYFYGGK